jgi:glycosyltransferase involved in cell wall biosynthesis
MQAGCCPIAGGRRARCWRNQAVNYSLDAGEKAHNFSLHGVFPKGQPMKLSVVIPCLNAAQSIGYQLAALRKQAWDRPWEVIVADNGSSDATVDVVRKNSRGLPCVQVVDASDLPGSAYARNVGALFARGESIVFCDADDEVGNGWLAAIGAALETRDFVASRFDIEKLNPLWVSGKLKNPQGAGLQRVAYPPFLCHAGGSGLGIKRAIHQWVGGFDVALPRLQDTDYCFRVQRLGIDLHFVADAVIHIRYSDNPVALFRQARLWAQYNALMYKRYGGGSPLKDPWRGYTQTWRDLICCMPRILRKETRTAWMKTLGTQIGLLQGVLRFRVPPVG